jgi:hypothetical protein
MFKIIFTIGIVYVIWWAFKFRTKIGAAYKEVQAEKARERGETLRPKAGQPVVQDLAPCPKCGAYVAVGSLCSCERA